jgi:hypothetical protein
MPISSPSSPEATGASPAVVLSRTGKGDWLSNDASFVVLAHNTAPDPRFIYANRTAQNCFEYSWDEFTALPSRLSVEQPIAPSASGSWMPSRAMVLSTMRAASGSRNRGAVSGSRM